MRGRSNPQSSFICLVNIEDRTPRAHPIREVKRQIDQVLKSMDPTFEKLYVEGGRNSVPPERLLKARVFMALYSVRSERLPYDALLQWFMDINMEEAAELAFDASVFAKNQSRFLEGKVSEVFFTQVVELARKGGLTSDEHFSVDGTLIDALDKLKERGFKPRTLGADKGYHNQVALPAKGRNREGLPRARSFTALRPDRRAAGGRTRRAHHEERQLQGQPDRAAAHRADLRLGQEHRRTEQERAPRHGAGQRRVPVCGRSLQPAAHGPVGDEQPRTTNGGGA